MTEEQLAALKEIRALLKTGYEHYFKFSDGCCKANEGYVEVMYPNYFDEDDGANPMEATGLMVYSYVLGPSRSHYWHLGEGQSDYSAKYSDNPFREALADVKEWVKKELAADD